jgi:hypothetical protein
MFLQAVENRAFVYLHRDGKTVIFFLVQVLGVEVASPTESIVRSFEAFVTINLSITIIN